MAESLTFLTESEVEGMMLGTDTFSALRTVDRDAFDAFADIMADSGQDLGKKLSDERFEVLKAALDDPRDLESLANARALADNEAKTQITQMTRTELNKIGDVIADGLEKGLGPDDIARNLDSVIGLDGPRAKKIQGLKDFFEEQGLTMRKYKRSSRRLTPRNSGRGRKLSLGQRAVRP